MQRTKASTTSSGKLAYWTMFWPRSSMSCGVLGAAFLRVRKAVKRILVQETQAGINGRAAPGFQAVKAHPVQDGRGREHLGGGHAGGGHGLMAVPQDGVIEKNRFYAHEKAI